MFTSDVWKSIFKYIGVFILGAVITLVIYLIYLPPYHTNISNIYSIKDEKISYCAETNELIFVNRVSNKIDAILSKEVTDVAYLIKAASVQQDYTNSVPQGKSSAKAQTRK